MIFETGILFRSDSTVDYPTSRAACRFIFFKIKASSCNQISPIACFGACDGSDLSAAFTLLGMGDSSTTKPILPLEGMAG